MLRNIIDYIRDRPVLFSILGGVLLVIIVGVALIIGFVDMPLKAGHITSMQVEPLRIYYEQSRSEVTRTEIYTAPVTHTRSVSDGNGHYRTQTYTTVETKTRHVFDHWRYHVYKVIDNEDYVISITAPSKKNHGKMLTATFYVTADRFKGMDPDGGWFEFNRKRGDRRMDFNNESILIATQDYTPFDMSKYNQE